MGRCTLSNGDPRTPPPRGVCSYISLCVKNLNVSLTDETTKWPRLSELDGIGPDCGSLGVPRFRKPPIQPSPVDQQGAAREAQTRLVWSRPERCTWSQSPVSRFGWFELRRW